MVSIDHKTLKRLGGVLLATVLLVGVSVALWSQADADEPTERAEEAEEAEIDPDEEPAEPEAVEEPSDDEIETYAEVQVTVVKQQIELMETLSEIGEEAGLAGQEITTAEQVLNAAGGDPEAVDEAYLDDDRYAEAIFEIAAARSEASAAIDRAVEESHLDRERFEELTILLSHDRRLSAEANALVNEKLEEAGVIEEPQIDVPDPEDESPDGPAAPGEDDGEIEAPELPDPESAE